MRSLQQRFDKFLDYVCGDIISDRERENTRNELYDHLMCIYECNLAQGMDEEKATIEAENSMGFHAPAEAVRILGESINFTRMGLMALTGVQPVHTNIAVRSGG